MPRALQDRLTICPPARALCSLAHPHWCPTQHSQPCRSLSVAQAASPRHACPTLLEFLSKLKPPEEEISLPASLHGF